MTASSDHTNAGNSNNKPRGRHAAQPRPAAQQTSGTQNTGGSKRPGQQGDPQATRAININGAYNGDYARERRQGAYDTTARTNAGATQVTPRVGAAQASQASNRGYRQAPAGDRTRQIPPVNTGMPTMGDGYAASRGRSADRRGGQGQYAPDDGGYFEQVPVAARYGGEGVKRRRHVAAKVIGVLIAILAVIYLAGVFYFSNRFFPNTNIGSVDVSLMSYADAKEAVSDDIDNYSLTLSGEDFELTVTSNEGGFNFDSSGVVNEAASDMNAWAWPVGILQSHDETSKLADAASTEGLDDIVTTAVNEFNQTATASEDATITYNESKSAFEIKSEVYGTQLDSSKVLAAAEAAITDLDSTVTIDESYQIKPTVVSTDSDLNSAITAANDLIDVDCTLIASGTDVQMATVDASVLGPMVTLDDSLNPSIDQDALTTWAQTVADNFSTVGDERTYTRPNGKTVTISGGDYGWETDAASIVTAVNSAIESNATGEVEVEITGAGNGYVSASQDFGAYIDVDLTEQHAYYYDADGNLLWDAGIVSGKPDGEDDTPTGLWYLKGKQTDVTLVGQNDPETNEPTYESPVSFWMPFIGNSYGLHDASWQPSWVFSDATAYQTYGSHGCVNLQYDAAASLYELVEYGDPVIVHW
jgi:lipoprotein-anchoring transpeptidase ErfK/SrfK